MFHKFCLFMAFAGLVGVADAAEKIPQVLTSEVFYDSGAEEYAASASQVMQEPTSEQNGPAYGNEYSSQENGYQVNEANGYSAEGYSTNRYPASRYAAKGFSENGYPMDDYSAEGYSEIEYSGNGFSTNKYSTSRYATKGFSANMYPGDGYSAEEFSEIEYSTNVYPIEDFGEESAGFQDAPVWPLAGSEADVELACVDSGCSNKKVVSKIGSGLVIENNIVTNGAGWTGGPNIMNGNQIPAGFDYECANGAEMPLMRREMMEDDGGTVLAMSRSSHKNCNKSADSYAVFAQRAGFAAEKTCNATSDTSISVNEYIDEETPSPAADQVRSWVVTDGQTLRQVLQSWCDKEGWDLVWTTSREYPIEASAVFKGRFVDVASALVRNFERATPIPYAKFYKGNRVIVISTTEE